MGSSKQDRNGNVAVVSVTTDLLKDKLNRVYSRFHARGSRSISHEGLFEYLWDLKEVALVEGKKSIDLPQSWLDDLETELEIARTH